MSLANQTFGNMNNQAVALSRIIENISNSNSLGYKKNNVNFVEVLNGEVVKVEEKDFSQGGLRKTSELFDLALEGKGFFEIELENGQRAYTRVGKMKLNANGELVTNEGYRVIPQEETEGRNRAVIERTPSVASTNEELGTDLSVDTPKLIIPSTLTPEIMDDGTVKGIDEDSGKNRKIGKINVVVFNNPSGLESLGKGYFIPTKSSGAPINIKTGSNESTKIKQGFLEFGNVSLAQEFMNLSRMRDSLTAQIKLLKAIDKLYENINYTIGRSV